MINTKVEGGWTYPSAQDVKRSLQSLGVEAGETTGGLWVRFDMEKHGPAVFAVVQQAGGRFTDQTVLASLIADR